MTTIEKLKVYQDKYFNTLAKINKLIYDEAKPKLDPNYRGPKPIITKIGGQLK